MKALKRQEVRMSCKLSIILLSVTIHIHNHDLASSVHTCIYIGGNRVNVQISLHRKTTKVGGDLPTNGGLLQYPLTSK